MKAITILELVIVMSIVAILMGLGFFGFSTYRTTVQLQNAYTDFTTGLKTLQNKSANSISVVKGGTTRVNPYIYAFRVSSNVHTPYFCELQGTSGTLINCSIDSSEKYNNLQNTSNVDVTMSCDGVGIGGIGYVRLTGDMVGINSASFGGTNSFISTGICTVTLTHKISSSVRVINIDLSRNTFSLQ